MNTSYEEVFHRNIEAQMIEVNEAIIGLRERINAKRQQWADDMNAKLNIPKGGIDCGIWGTIGPYSRYHCFKQIMPEDNELTLLKVKRAELAKLIQREAKELLPY